MKLIEYSIIKLQYNSEGRLFMRSFKNVRTNNPKYYRKKEDEVFKNYNPKTDVIALWDMHKDELYFYEYPLKRNFLTISCWLNSSICLTTYPYSISPVLKRYIKSER